jgi:predicted outer membrane repeat protein
MTDCTFENNVSEDGGAIYNNGRDGTASFTVRGNSVFRRNEADHRGGAIYTFANGPSSEANPILEGVVFDQNRAAVNTTMQELGGGAIWNAANSGGTASPQITNSSFTGNEAVGDPGNNISTLGGAIKSQSNNNGSTVSLTIENTSFENNFAVGAGGALFNIAFDGAQVNSSITGSTFLDNTAGSAGALLLVGFQGVASTPPKATNSIGITNTTFAGNQAVDTGLSVPDDVSNVGRPRLGGSIYILAERGGRVDATVENVDITGGAGQDAHTGGGVLVAADTVQSGDGSQLSLADPTFRNVTFQNLQAERGGAVTVFADEEEARPRFENVTISSATAATAGGAVEVVARNADPSGNDARAEPTFVNTTITGNSAARGGAIYDSTDTPARVATTALTNTILWSDSAETGAEIYNANNGTATIDHSIVQGSGGSGGSWDGSLGTDGGDNLDQDPRFAGGASLAGADGELRTADDSLALTVRSPALDAGANGAAPSTDITGANRVRDLDGDETATVNMGAYETARPTAPAPEGGPVASATGAALRGSVNPWGAKISRVRFRLSRAGSDRDTTVNARPLGDGALTGTSQQPVRGTVRRLMPDTEYEARLVATNAEGTATSAPVTFRTPPAPALQAGGGDQTLTARLTAESGFDQDTTVFVRSGGDGDYRSRSVDPASGDDQAFTAEVPQTSISSRRGVDYYVAFEGESDTFRLPAGSQQAARERPLNLPVEFDTLSPPAAQARELFQKATYRMVSIPAETDAEAALTETYGPYDPAAWRLLRWDPAGGSGQYREFPDLSGSAFEPGKAFWLISSAGTRLGLQGGQSVDASAPLAVTLEPGWNQLGNPFGFAVPWSAVLAASDADASQIGTPLTYRDEAYVQSTAGESTVLRPWEGYFVLNTSSGPKTLQIPPTRTSSQEGGTQSLAAAPSTKAGGGYTLRVSAQAKDRVSTTLLGLRRGAKAGRDTLDVAQPPPVEPAVRLGAVQTAGARGAVPHMKSMKPTGGKGRTWTLRLHRPKAGDTASEVRLDWSGAGSLPEAQSRYVIDPSAETRMTPGQTVTLDEGETRRLKVIVGTERYAEKNSAGASLTSYENELRSNYPNPFEKQTTLEYTLSEERPVRIAVYNILGQRVRTLVDGRKTAGLHRAQWDGTNRYGDRVGSGVYFYRIEAGDFSASKKMVLVR